MGYAEHETERIPTIEKLLSEEKEFGESFAETTVPVLLWLNELRTGGNPAWGNLKEYIQSQNLPSIPELRKTDSTEWADLYQSKIESFRKKADKPSTESEKQALAHAIDDRRVMAGLRPAKTPEEQALPHFIRTAASGRDFISVPEPRPYTYRINVPDAPGELREVILDGLVKKFWDDPAFKKHGFQAKIIGFAKTDGLVLYLGDETINAALKIVSTDAVERGYGRGEPARFAQALDARIPGITVVTNPKDKDGKSAGTFGDVVGELLAVSLQQGMKESGKNADDLIRDMLDHRFIEWSVEVLQPAFEALAQGKFGKKLNLHNLAFIDKSHL